MVATEKLNQHLIVLFALRDGIDFCPIAGGQDAAFGNATAHPKRLESVP